MKNDRPPPRTPERREWVLSRVRLAWAEAERQGFIRREFSISMFNKLGSKPHPCHNDINALGGWHAVLEAALGPGESPRQVRIVAPRVETPPVATAPDPVTEHVAAREQRSWKAERAELLERIDAMQREAAHASAVRADAPPPSIQRRERASGMREATAIVLASDWHVEETVLPETVNSLNAYDLAIAERRARKFFDGISWLLDAHATHFRIRDLVLWLGGDLITGYIHEELVESNGLSPLYATRFVRTLVVEGIRMLLSAHPELDRIIVPCSHGNHGRTTIKPRISTGADNSYEHLLYQTLADDFRDEPRVSFHVARGELVFVDVYGLKVRFTHGDAVKYAGGVGGITIPINKAIAAWDRSIRADLTCMGHWHQLTFASKCLVNGSLIGPSAYTVRIKAEMETAQQAFALIDSRRGVCQQTPVWVTSEGEGLDPAASAAVRERLAS